KPLVLVGDTELEAALFAVVALRESAFAGNAIVTDKRDAAAWAARTHAPHRSVVVALGEAGYSPFLNTSSAAVVLCVGREYDIRNMNAIVLPAQSRGSVEKELLGYSFDAHAAERLTRDSGGRLEALRRLLGATSPLPRWL